jgi:hypothetical protein
MPKIPGKNNTEKGRNGAEAIAKAGHWRVCHGETTTGNLQKL